jgi:hypothetical protein
VRFRRTFAILPKAAWNERLKLLAATLNAAGLAVFGFGALSPMFNGSGPPSGVQIATCGVIFGVLHWAAQWLLHLLED